MLISTPRTTTDHQSAEDRDFHRMVWNSGTLIADKLPLPIESFPMLESKALKLLSTLPDGTATRVHPLDFSALLQLRDRGYVAVSVTNGCVVAERTLTGKQGIDRKVRA
jgi:hypothetical protein